MQDAAQGVSATTSYTWNGVIEFLQEQLRHNVIKQNEWLLEKQLLLTKLGKAEGDLKALEVINSDLVKRVKMLEFCLRQERLKYATVVGNKNISTPELKNLFENPTQVPASPSNHINNAILQKRGAKTHRNVILKFLEEVGYDAIFAGNNLAEKESHNQTGIYPSHHNSDLMEPFRHPDEWEKTEHVSVLDRSSFKGDAQKSPDPRYSSGEDKVFYDNHYLANEQTPYLVPGDDKRQKNTNTSGLQRDSRSPIHFEPNSSEKVEWRQKYSLRGHFDGIWDIFVHSADSILCSVSEDCMIKIWDLNKIKKNRDSSSHVDPYLTFREDTGPLFAVTGPGDHLALNDRRLLFTAGSEGLIRVWDIPSAAECDTYGPNSKSYCIDVWKAHKDTIWELNHHPLKHTIMSLSADGYIKLWETVDTTRGEILSGKAKTRFYYQTSASDEQQGYLIPTSATWVHTNIHNIIAGYANSGSLIVFDEENGKVSGSLKYDPFGSGQRMTQPNKLLSHPHKSLLITAHEDRYLRFFDLKANKLTHSMLAHNDAVTSVCYNASTTNIMSVSHDGSIKVWDLRKYGLVQEIAGLHLKKYDEQIHCITSEESMQLLLTGGADGIINVLERV